MRCEHISNVTSHLLRSDLNARLSTAEGRVKEAESKLGDVEIKLRKAEVDLAEAGVKLEQSLSEQSHRLRKEFGDMQDGETRGLQDSLDVVKSQVRVEREEERTT